MEKQDNYKKKIYIAGPDVFFPISKEILEEKKQLCKKYGFEGISPLDNEIDLKKYSKEVSSMLIRKGNIKLIEKSDIVIANLNSFRGFEPDSGTCFEVGYATALDKVIYLYLDNSTLDLKERYCKFKGHEFDSSLYDCDGNSIENFSLPANLMFSGAKIKESFEECLIDLKSSYLIDWI